MFYEFKTETITKDSENFNEARCNVNLNMIVVYYENKTDHGLPAVTVNLTTGASLTLVIGYAEFTQLLKKKEIIT